MTSRHVMDNIDSPAMDRLCSVNVIGCIGDTDRKEVDVATGFDRALRANFPVVNELAEQKIVEHVRALWTAAYSEYGANAIAVRPPFQKPLFKP